MSIFKNGKLALDMETKGFAVLDAGLLAETAQIQAYISRHFELSPTDFYYSLLSNSAAENLAIRDYIREALAPFYEAHFTEYRTVTESFLSKPAHTAGELQLHQDWCYTDESQFAAYNVWLPLCDVDETNGALFFLPGSHRWFGNLRSASLPTARIAGNGNALAGDIESVSLRRGQALVFHPAVFHGSFPNGSGLARTVVTSTILDYGAPFLYYHKVDGAEEVDVYEMDDETFLRNLEGLAMQGNPTGSKRKNLSYIHRMVTESDLLAGAAAQRL